MSDMTAADFFTRFRDDQEIGRDITDTKLEVYYDNGQDIGRWVQNRRMTLSQYDLIPDDHAAAAKDWCKRLRQQQLDAAARRQGGERRQ